MGDHALTLHQMSERVNAITPQVDMGVLLEIHEQTLRWLDEAKELKARCERLFAEWIIETGHEVEFGDIRYYVAPDKTTKCKDVAKALYAIIAACNGDMDRLPGFLSSDPFKSGAARTLLGEDVFAIHFRTIMNDEKLQKGKPRKGLRSL